jgi:hypothetical protein
MMTLIRAYPREVLVEVAVPIMMVCGAIVLVVIVVATVVAMRQQARRTSVLARIASRLEQASQGGAAVTGRYQGIEVTYRFATRGSGSNSESWTEVEAAVPASYPLAIHVRRHDWRDRTHIERGDMIDVKVGDAEFDRAFLVEAAPADVVRRLLDGETRALLGAHQPVELDTIVDGDRKLLRLGIRQWIEDEAGAAALIERIAAIAARVRDGFAEADAALPARDIGGPFRQEVDGQPAHDAARAREAEVERLGAVRAARTARQDRIMVVGGAIGLAFALVIAAAIAIALR